MVPGQFDRVAQLSCFYSEIPAVFPVRACTLTPPPGETLLSSVVPSEPDRLSLISEERWTEDGEQLLQGSGLQEDPDPVSAGGFDHRRDPAAAAPCHQRRRPRAEEVPRQVTPASSRSSEPEHGSCTFGGRSKASKNPEWRKTFVMMEF